MDTSWIRKVAKARQYAQEPERFTFQQFSVDFQGSHHQHHVTYDTDGLHCDCEYFQTHCACGHTMALERVLKPMLRLPEPTEA